MTRSRKPATKRVRKLADPDPSFEETDFEDLEDDEDLGQDEADEEDDDGQAADQTDVAMGLDDASRFQNRTFNRMVERKASGEQNVRWAGQDLPKYNWCADRSLEQYAQSAQVRLTRYPDGTHLDLLPLINVPTFDKLVAVIKARFWRGGDEQFKWTMVVSGRQHVATDTITLEYDPERVLEYQRNRAISHTPNPSESTMSNQFGSGAGGHPQQQQYGDDQGQGQSLFQPQQPQPQQTQQQQQPAAPPAPQHPVQQPAQSSYGPYGRQPPAQYPATPPGHAGGYPQPSGGGYPPAPDPYAPPGYHHPPQHLDAYGRPYPAPAPYPTSGPYPAPPPVGYQHDPYARRAHEPIEEDDDDDDDRFDALSTKLDRLTDAITQVVSSDRRAAAPPPPPPPAPQYPQHDPYAHQPPPQYPQHGPGYPPYGYQTWERERQLEVHAEDLKRAAAELSRAQKLFLQQQAESSHAQQDQALQQAQQTQQQAQQTQQPHAPPPSPAQSLDPEQLVSVVVERVMERNAQYQPQQPQRDPMSQLSESMQTVAKLTQSLDSFRSSLNPQPPPQQQPQQQPAPFGSPVAPQPNPAGAVSGAAGAAASAAAAAATGVGDQGDPFKIFDLGGIRYVVDRETGRPVDFMTSLAFNLDNVGNLLKPMASKLGEFTEQMKQQNASAELEQKLHRADAAIRQMEDALEHERHNSSLLQARFEELNRAMAPRPETAEAMAQGQVFAPEQDPVAQGDWPVATQPASAPPAEPQQPKDPPHLVRLAKPQPEPDPPPPPPPASVDASPTGFMRALDLDKLDS